MNVFQTVKENVTARQAAEQYGLKVNKNAVCIGTDGSADPG